MSLSPVHRAGFAVALFLCFFHSQPAKAQDREETVRINTNPRTFLVHLPAGYDAKKRYPLVLALHGLGGDGQLMARVSHLDETADRFGFIVVYPNASEGRWTKLDPRPQGGGFGPIGRGRLGLGPPPSTIGRNSSEPGGEPINDNPFFDAMLDMIESEYRIDTSRVYATGFSDGGFMAFRLGCEMAYRISAIATVAATLPFNLSTTCTDWAWRSVPLLMINGTSDPIITYNGRPGLDVRYPLLGARETLKVWSKMDGCVAKSVKTKIAPHSPDGMETQVDTYNDCHEGGAAILYSIEKGGHAWPGGDPYLPERLGGALSHDLDAGEAIWQFFAAHPFPPASH
jgi:polyhydroxybutyrate depolymerase